MHRSTLVAFAVALAAPLHAQGSPFQTPGIPAQKSAPASSPTGGDAGQTDRFDAGFNPAFAFVIDSIADYVDADDEADGFDLQMRSAELSMQAWVDPDAWAYVVAVADEESLAVEEAAVHYRGLGGNHTLRAGRFFIDFGKQMQTHLHELRTLERPLVLRTYLGSEVSGDGVQWDSWTPVSDEGALRWSIGVFANTLGGHEHGEHEEEEEEPERSVPDRKKLDELNFTARVTAFFDVGSNSVLQVGTSARLVPEFSLATDDVEGPDGLSSSVFGVDVTWGWTSDTGLATWTVCAEALLSTGDTGSDLDDAGTPLDPSDDTLSALDDDLFGAFAYVDHAWDKSHSVGVQFSQAEIAAGLDAQELEAYYSRLFSEYHRVRFSISHLDVDGDDDALRAALQYTVFVGAHGHGINW